jgi:RND family efflux transporter MFP subunit
MKHRILTILSLVLIAASCNTNSPEMAERQIQKLKGQAKEINEKIAALEAGMTVDSTEDVKFRIPVTVKEMKPENFSHFIDITGKLEAEEDAFISPEMNGQIETIHVKEGQSVKNGQLLISLNTSVIESSILEVKTGLELAEKLYEKQKELWDQSIGSELQYLEAKSAMEQAEARLATLEAQLDMARIRAPFSGIVESIIAKEGELAAPGMQVVQLVSLDKLKLYGSISERYLMSIKKGDRVIVSFPDLGDLSITAPIFRVGNVIDNATRTFKIEVKVDNRNKSLKPNMYSIIRVNDFSSDKAFVVPSVAIKQDIKGNYTYVADTEDMKARKKYITTGLTYEDQTMVEEGLSEGEMVIVKGFAQVSDGMDIDLR